MVLRRLHLPDQINKLFMGLIDGAVTQNEFIAPYKGFFCGGAWCHVWWSGFRGNLGGHWASRPPLEGFAVAQGQGYLLCGGLQFRAPLVAHPIAGG